MRLWPSPSAGRARRLRSDGRSSRCAPPPHLSFAQDFAAVEHAHGQFVAAIRAHSLLNMPSWTRALAEVFGTARELTRLVRGAKERGLDCDLLRVRCTRRRARVRWLGALARRRI